MRDPPSVSPLHRRQVTATFCSWQGKMRKALRGDPQSLGHKNIGPDWQLALPKVATNLSEVMGQADGVARTRASGPEHRPYNSL